MVIPSIYFGTSQSIGRIKALIHNIRFVEQPLILLFVLMTAKPVYLTVCFGDV